MEFTRSNHMFQMEQVIKYDPSSNPDKPQQISLLPASRVYKSRPCESSILGISNVVRILALEMEHVNSTLFSSVPTVGSPLSVFFGNTNTTPVILPSWLCKI